MMTLDDLKSIDDGGSFDRLVEEVGEIAKGDEALKDELLTKAVVLGLVDMQVRKARERKLLAEETFRQENNRVEVGYTNFVIPKKITRHVSARDVSKAESTKKSMKSGFSEVETEEMVKKPAAKKQRKADSSEKKMKKKNSDDQSGSNPPPNLPQQFKDRIQSLNGTNIMLVIQKELTASDMNTDQGRFTMPRGKVITHDFVSEEEMTMLNKKKDKAKKDKEGIKCSLIEPCLEETNLELTKWDMNNTFSYILIRCWNSVAYNSNNQLAVGCMVQLWSFRVGSDLWFALVKLEQEEEDNATCSTAIATPI